MQEHNYNRMIQLATDVFDTKNDPEQLDVNEEVMERLRSIHPFTISEHRDENGPVIWILLIPTTSAIMYRFLNKEITEQQLLEFTMPGASYDAIYLCSALVLPEYRGKGLAQKLTLEAIENIRQAHRIHTLFVWPFSDEGLALAKSVSRTTGIALLERLT
jgi:GNAT superfamily N-acetyltransferase